MTKPVVSYIAGLAALEGSPQVGHAGAVVSSVGESAQEKVEIPSRPPVSTLP